MKRSYPANGGRFSSLIAARLPFASLRGRRLKGKRKGVLGARETPRVSLAPKTPFPFPFKRLPRRLALRRLEAFVVVRDRTSSIKLISRFGVFLKLNVGQNLFF